MSVVIDINAQIKQKLIAELGNEEYTKLEQQAREMIEQGEIEFGPVQGSIEWELPLLVQYLLKHKCSECGTIRNTGYMEHYQKWFCIDCIPSC